MKVIYLPKDKSRPWTRHNMYQKLIVGKTYEGTLRMFRGLKWMFIEELDYSFADYHSFIPLEIWRQLQVESLLT
jgi:hypothetical protein